MKKGFLLSLATLFAVAVSPSLAAGKIDPEMAKLRREKLNSRARRVIFNNDGCEISSAMLRTPSVANFLKLRHNGLLNSHVEVISYCPVTTGFGNVSYQSKICSDLTNHPGFKDSLLWFYKNNTDPMMESCRFAHANNMESFYSMRMNDCHDAFSGGNNLWPPFKSKHPELLFGTAKNKPHYGYWSGVDYSRKEIRDMACAIIKEAVEKFPLDGVELDFCRHWAFLRSAAYGDPVTQSEIDNMTGMIRQMRIICDEAGKKRNRPILLMVRVLDSVEACLAQGLDLEKWCADGLVDIVAGGSEIRLNQTAYMAELSRKYPHVKFYSTQTEAQMAGQHALLKRNNNPLNFRGQAAVALYEKVGIYSFNEYSPGLDHSRYLNEIGDEKLLMGLNKFYYFSHIYSNAGSFGRDWERFQVMPRAVPHSPMPFNHVRKDIELYCGRENPGAKMLLLLQLRNASKDNIQVHFNGSLLKNGSTLDGLAVYEVPQKIWNPGKNRVSLQTAGNAKPRVLLAGDQLLVYGKNQGAWRRLFGSEGFVAGKSEYIQDNAYVLCDLTGSYVSNLVHPLEALPGSDITISSDVKLGFSDTPEGAVMRIANGVFTETLQFHANGVKLKNAGFFHACDTTGSFRNYRMNIKNNTLSLSIDGVQVYREAMKTAFADDAEVVEKYSAAKTGYLAGNSIIIGSLSPEGKSRISFRNLSVLNSAVAGYLVDGALLVIHKPDERDLPVSLLPTVARRIPAKSETMTVALTPADHAQWVKIGGKSNFAIQSDGFLINSRVNGPMIRHLLKAKCDFLEVQFSFTVKDKTERNPQLQALIILDGIAGKSNLWGFRFTEKSVRFADDAEVTFPVAPDGKVTGKIIVDPKSGASEVYIGSSNTPVLRHRPIVVNRTNEVVSFGDGSVAIKGETLLHDAKIIMHGVKAPATIKDKLPAKAAAVTGISPARQKEWRKLFFNAANLVTAEDHFQLNNQRGGPMLRYNFAKGDMDYLAVEFEFSPLDEKCTKGQLQSTIITDGMEKDKSYLYGFRFGKDHFRFLDEAALPVKPGKDGKIHVLLLIDRKSDKAEIFFNHSPFPALIHKALKIKRGTPGITFGDGSAAVEGACKFYRAEVKIY